jgi:hypothetical protein
MLRLTPAVMPTLIASFKPDASTPNSALTSKAAERARAVEAALNRKPRTLGVGCHIGSQILDAPFFTLAARLMVEFLAEIRDDLGWNSPNSISAAVWAFGICQRHSAFDGRICHDLVGTVRENLEKFGLRDAQLEHRARPFPRGRSGHNAL